MRITRTSLALLLAAALAAGGCAAAVGAGLGLGGYKYSQGSFDTSYQKPYEQVYDATTASLKQMDMPITKTQRDAAGAHIDAKRADGTPVKINLKKVSADNTTASIRIGTFGNEDASRVIANNIARHLGEPERGRGGNQ